MSNSLYIDCLRGKIAQRTKVLCSKVVNSAAILSLHQIRKIFESITQGVESKYV
jgi:hypothetical protein